MIDGKNGYTLVELAITLCLIGIIASTAGSEIMRAIPGISLKSVVNNLAGDIRLARSLSVKNQVPVSIVFTTIQPGVYNLFVNGVDIKSVNLGDFRGGVRLGVGGAKVDATEKSAPFPENFDYCRNETITFSPNGMNTVGSFGYKYLCNENNDVSYAVGLTSLAGIVTVKKNGGGDSWITL